MVHIVSQFNTPTSVRHYQTSLVPPAVAVFGKIQAWLAGGGCDGDVQTGREESSADSSRTHKAAYNHAQ